MRTLRLLLGILALLFAMVAFAQPSTPTNAAAYRISGTVVDRLTGQTLADTTVVLAPVTARQDIRSFKTSTNGQFVFANLPRGKYSLGASRRGYQLQNYEQHEGFSIAIAVGPGLDGENLVFRLRPDASIRGTITDEQGEPVAGASVSLYGSRLQNGENTIRVVGRENTDDRGDYSFSHLPDGTYYIAVSGRPWYNTNMSYTVQSLSGTDQDEVARAAQESRKLDLIYPLSFYSGARSSDDATPLRLNPGETARADLTLQPVPSIHIRIPVPPQPENTQTETAAGFVTSNGGISRVGRMRMMGGPGVRVELFQQVFGDLQQAETSGTWGSGEAFQVSGIAPGHYLVQISSTDGKGASNSSAQEMDISGDIDLAPTTANALAVVSGTVQLNGTDPPDNTFLQLRSRGSTRGYGAQIKKGEFEFEEHILPGRYEVLLGGSGDFYLSTMTVIGAKLAGRSALTITDQPVRLAITAGQGVAQIDGVANLDGKAKAGAMILLIPSGPSANMDLVRRDQSDSDGTFTLPRIIPGRYYILAIKDGWDLQFADPKVLKPYLSNAHVYDIQPNQKLQITLDVQSTK